MFPSPCYGSEIRAFAYSVVRAVLASSYTFFSHLASTIIRELPFVFRLYPYLALSGFAALFH